MDPTTEPLTADRILAEPAGRTMDAWIAEHIFVTSGKVSMLQVPHYSTDIAAAWQVVEWLRGFYGSISIIGGDSWHCYPVVDCRPIVGMPIGSGESMPLAVCRAALLVSLTREGERK